MNSKTVLSYLCIFVISTVIFLVVLFPQERIAARLSRELSPPGGDIQTIIERVRPSLPNRLYFENSRFIYKNKTQIQPESLAVRITPGLVFKKNKKIRFDSNVYQGKFNGTIGVHQGQKPEIKDVDIEMDGIKVENYSYNTRMADITLSCTINGKYSSAEDDAAKGVGQGSVNISGFEAELRRSLLNRLKLSKIDFSAVDIEFAKSGKAVDIKMLKARGSVINVNLKGRITVGNTVSDSRLSLTGNILPDSPYLATLINSAFIRSVAKNAQKTGIRFSIKGTLEQPRITL